MDISSLLYDLFKNFMYGDNVLETWQEQFLLLITTATCFLLLYKLIMYIFDFVYSFFRKF